MSTFVQIELVHVDCTCGFHFGMDRPFHEKCREQGLMFYCPKCRNSLIYTKSENQKLKSEIESLQRKLQWEKDSLSRAKQDKLATERRLAAAKGVATRLKNRVKNGVCPCCNRYFENLHKHMKTQHPDEVQKEST